MSDQERNRGSGRRSRRRTNRMKHDPQRPDISARVEAEARQRDKQGSPGTVNTGSGGSSSNGQRPREQGPAREAIRDQGRDARSRRDGSQSSTRNSSSSRGSNASRSQEARRPVSIADRMGEPTAERAVDRPVERLSDRIGSRFPARTATTARRKGFAGSRPDWIPPEVVEPELPELICPRCGKPVEDYAQAVGDANSTSFWHFDCALERLTEEAQPREGEKVVYIGGGRFALVHFPDPRDTRQFQIRRIIPWEDKDKRPEWRIALAGKYSRT